jgi:lysozyme family protein
MTTLRKGEHGIQVRKVQLLLNSLVVPSPHLKVDGVLGARTEEAVRAFQASKGLVVDGVVGARTLLALGLKETLAPTMPVISPLAPWMDIAVAELGVHEDSLPGHHNTRILEYHQCTALKATTDETAWCSSFVNWVLSKAGRRGTNSALANSWLN